MDAAEVEVAKGRAKGKGRESTLEVKVPRAGPKEKGGVKTEVAEVGWGNGKGEYLG